MRVGSWNYNRGVSWRGQQATTHMKPAIRNYRLDWGIIPIAVPIRWPSYESISRVLGVTNVNAPRRTVVQFLTPIADTAMQYYAMPPVSCSRNCSAYKLSLSYNSRNEGWYVIQEMEIIEENEVLPGWLKN